MIFSGVAFEDCANPKGPIRATMIHRTSVEDWGRDGIAMTLPYLLAVVPLAQICTGGPLAIAVSTATGINPNSSLAYRNSRNSLVNRRSYR